jgi:DtxR family Mn-dependent transcriptional regulator
MRLTAIQEDYLEVVYHLSGVDDGSGGVRATDIADRLGCRLPTVTRTIQKMVDAGFFEHEARGLVRLTGHGRSLAEDIAHRHIDTVAFLVKILGLTEDQAERDACQIEHGLSPLAAQRLHEFLEHVKDLDPAERRILTKFARTASLTATNFPHLIETRTAGWRG